MTIISINETILNSLPGVAGRIRDLLFYQIVAVIVILAALMTSQHKILRTQKKIEQTKSTIEKLQIAEVSPSWQLDSVLFARSSNKYDKEFMEKASHLAIFTGMAATLLAVSSGSKGKENSKIEQFSTEIGHFTQRLNRLRQSLIRLENPARNGKRIVDLNVQELEAYAEYLAFEENVGSWKGVWGKVCNFSVLLNRVRGDIAKANSDSFGSKLMRSEKGKILTKWGASQLIRQSNKPGDVATIVELESGNHLSKLLMYFARDVGENDKLDFRTLRHYGVSTTYGSTDQLHENSTRIKGKIIPALKSSKSASIGALQDKLRIHEDAYEKLKEERRVPLPLIHSDLPVSYIVWILPLANAVMLIMVFRIRRNVIKLLDHLTLSPAKILEITRAWPYTFIYSSSDRAFIMWDIIRDSAGLAGLTMVALIVHFGVGSDLVISLRPVVFIAVMAFLSTMLLASLIWMKWITLNYSGTIANAPSVIKIVCYTVSRKIKKLNFGT